MFQHQASSLGIGFYEGFVRRLRRPSQFSQGRLDDPRNIDEADAIL